MIKMKKFFRVHPIIYVTGVISLFTDLSSQMIVPLLPLFLTLVLHAQVASVGLIEGFATSVSNILKLFSGWLSDRIGKRKALMVVGYGLSNIIKPFFSISESWSQVFALRFIERIGKGVRGAPRDSLIADSTTKEERGRAFGFHRAMDTLGAALGPLIAFIILSLHPRDYRMVFWASAIPGILGIIIAVVFLKEKGQDLNTDKKQIPKITFKGLDPRLIRFTLIATLFAIGNSSDAFLVLRAQSIGMAVAIIPLAYFVFNLTYSLASAPIGALSDKIGRRTVVVGGYVIFALIYLGFGLAHSVAWIWILFIIYGLYYAATEGVQKAYIGDMVKQGQRGTAMGTFNALTGFAALPASILPGYLWQAFGPTVAFGYSTVIALIAAILMMILKV
jgi:MFS family permease